MTLPRTLGALLLLGVLLASLPARAQPAPPAARSDGFEPVDGNMMAPGEAIPGNRLVGAAYGFILGALVVYVGSVTIRTRRVEAEIEAQRRRTERASGSAK